MTVLVTGAGGFLGGRIVRALAESGQAVRGLDLSYPAPLPDGVERVEGSILEPGTVAAAVEGTTGVIHAAGIARLWTPGRFDYDRVNVVGTCRVLAAARRGGVPMVHVSSYTTLMARETAPDAVLDETVELPPNALCGPYPRSKRQAELAVQAAAAAGQRVCIVLPSAPLGAGDVNLTPPAAMLRDLARGSLPALLACRLNLVDAAAVAEAAIAALDLGKPGARYLLSGEDIEIGDFAQRVADLTGVPAPRRRVPYGVALAAARVEAALGRAFRRAPQAPLTGVRLARVRATFDAREARDVLGFAPRPLGSFLAEALDDLRARGVIKP